MSPETAESTLKPKWARVDEYCENALDVRDSEFEAMLESNRAAGLPAIDISPLQGRMLAILARATGARRVLEIGTLGGYSTAWLAQAIRFQPGALVMTLELDQRHAGIAMANLYRAGLWPLVDLRVGPAFDTLTHLVASDEQPFDLIFIDADKAEYAGYLHSCARLARKGTLLIADNVVRHGEVANPESKDKSVRGVQECLAAFTKYFEFEWEATVIQTVGSKGYDGFLMAVRW